MRGYQGQIQLSSYRTMLAIIPDGPLQDLLNSTILVFFAVQWGKSVEMSIKDKISWPKNRIFVDIWRRRNRKSPFWWMLGM